MYRLFLGMALVAASSLAIANETHGAWTTEAGKDGGYLEVTLGACDSDASKTCGTITKAYTTKGVDPDYVNLGTVMVKHMKSKDGKNYSGGTIWDPEDNKTYKSKMHLKGDMLDVEGCISFFCSGQDWERVK